MCDVIGSCRTRGPGPRRSSLILSAWVGAVLILASGCAPSRREFFSHRLPEVIAARRSRPHVRLDYTQSFGNEIGSEPGRFDQRIFRLHSRLPLPLSRDRFLIVGLDTSVRQLDLTRPFPGFTEDETLYKISTALGAGAFLNDRWLVQAMVVPGIASDLDGTLHHQDYRVWGAGVAQYKFSADTYGQLGVAVTDDFDRFAVYPIIGISTRLWDRWHLDLLVPQRLELAYHTEERSSIYLGLDIEGEQYHRRTRDSSGIQQRVDIQMQELRSRLGFVYRFTPHLSTYAELGMTITGNYELRTPAGTVDGDIQPNIFFMVGTGYDF